MTEIEQLEQDCCELLTKVTPTISLKLLRVNEYYLLPADNVRLVKRLLIEIDLKTGICQLKSCPITPPTKKNSAVHYDICKVHYSWLRSLNHTPQFQIK